MIKNINKRKVAPAHEYQKFDMTMKKKRKKKKRKQKPNIGKTDTVSTFIYTVCRIVSTCTDTIYRTVSIFNYNCI